MRKDVHLYLVAYDVPDDRRRSRIASTLQAFGLRVQYSVFLVEVAPVKRARLERALMSVINTTEDSVIIGDLGPRSSSRATVVTLGRPRHLMGTDSFIL